MTSKTKNTNSDYPQFLNFNCCGKIVTIRPSISFWNLAKGTIFELKKYDPQKPTFVNISAYNFHKYVAAIFTQGLVCFDTEHLTFRRHITLSNIKYEIESWIGNSIVWRAVLESKMMTFLGNFMHKVTTECRHLSTIGICTNFYVICAHIEDDVCEMCQKIDRKFHLVYDTGNNIKAVLCPSNKVDKKVPDLTLNRLLEIVFEEDDINKKIYEFVYGTDV